MGVIDPWQAEFRRAIEPTVVEVPFPEFEAVLKFRHADVFLRGQMYDLSDDLIQRHVTGDEVRGTAPIPITFVGLAEKVPMSRSLCLNLAAAMTLCVVEEGGVSEEQKDEPLFWLGIARNFDHRWKEILKALKVATDEPAGNSPMAGTTAASKPASN